MEVNSEIESLLSKRFDIKFWERLSKADSGYLNFSYYEINIQNKAPDGRIKTIKSIAYPEITTISIKDQENLVLDLSEKSYQIHIQMESSLYLLKCVYLAFKIFFPCEDIFNFFTVKTEDSISIESIKEEVKKIKVSVQAPCNNFTWGIKFFAKYQYLTENEEINWDIDTVYGSRDTKMFVLKDFDHLKQKYLFPVLGVMCYNTYFTELSLSNVDLTMYDKLLERVFKYNKSFKKLHFVNCNLKLPLCSAIANGMEGQRSLICLDLSRNEGIMDKGLDLFLPFLKKHSQYLEIFRMSKCNLNSISICKIADSFTYTVRGNECFIQLRVLDISFNPLKEGFKEIFHDFISKCNYLEDLNLAGMNCSIEQLPTSLLKGPLKTLKYLNLSDNISPLSNQSCTQWSLLFEKVVSLIQVNLTNFRSLDCSVTDGLFLGLKENKSLSTMGVDVIISNSSFNTEVFNRFVNFIFQANCVTHLDFSFNGIELEITNLLKTLPEFSSLKALNISNNFLNLKQKDHQTIINNLTNAMQLETVNLQELYIANCNFGNNLSAFISELDCFFSLQILDISGNNIGNIVARTLGRMLTIDKHLKEIIMDNNNVVKEIYEEILDGLENNFTLTTFHVPFVDLVKYNPRLVVPIIEKINKHHIKVNKIFQGISFDDIKVMAFNCIMNQTSENIDKCRAKLQESCNRLKSINSSDPKLQNTIKNNLEKSLNTIKSVEKSRDLLAKLNSIYKDNYANPSLSTDIRIKKVTETICSSVSELLNDYLHEVVDELIKEISMTMPLLYNMNNNFSVELIDICKKSMVVSNEYIKKLFERFIETNLMKKVYETQVNVTNLLCDRVTDEIISQMNICDIKTNQLYNASFKINGDKKPSLNSISSIDDTSPGPVIRNLDEKKDRKCNETARTSRMSHLSATKARPLSKAIKNTLQVYDIKEDTAQNSEIVTPVVPGRTKRLPVQTIQNASPPKENLQSNEDPLLNSLKNRPKPVKNVKPKIVSPTTPTLEQSNSISDENWNNFHSPVNDEDCKTTETPMKKKPFFTRLKPKKSKSPNVDLDHLGKEIVSDSDIENDTVSSLEEKSKNQQEDSEKNGRVSKKSVGKR